MSPAKAGLVLLASAAALAAAPAFAQDLTPEQIIHRHVDNANKGDPAAMAADYAEDAVMLEPGHALHGRAAIQAAFNGIFGPGARTRLTITPIRIWSEGDVGFISWEAAGGRIKGTDDYLVRHGKIIVQAVFIGGAPRPSPPK